MSTRTNGFGEKYFTTDREVRRFLDSHENGWDVHVPQIDPPETGSETATAAICENESGDTVCYIEADTVADVEALIEELNIEML